MTVLNLWSGTLHYWGSFTGKLQHFVSDDIDSRPCDEGKFVNFLEKCLKTIMNESDLCSLCNVLFFILTEENVDARVAKSASAAVGILL